MTARTTHVGTIFGGFALWSLAVGWPASQWYILVLSGALVAWAVYRLLTAPNE